MAVVVRWRRLIADEATVAQQAREVAQCVVRHLQRPLDAPVVETSRPDGARGQGWQTQQASAPLGYVEPYERLVSLEWLGDNGEIRFARADGSIVEAKNQRDQIGTRIVAGVDEIGPQRRPMQIHYRPGQGGHRRRVLEGEIDVREGLETYGEVTWISAPGGASVGVIDLDPQGNTVIDVRLSSSDRNETLVDQVDASFGLVRRVEEMRPRKILLAERMSGKREVRPERAGPPPPGLLERDDMLLLDQWLAEGWVEHLVLRDPTRIARELLPGYTLLDRWARHGVGLWLAEWGRKADYQADRTNLGVQMIVSAEERARMTRNMQSAKIRKGPLVGKGWVGRNRFGFMRDRAGNLIQDPEQWPWIRRAFDLADGVATDGPGLSTRDVTAALAAEGCTFDHDRVRTLLKDKIYATGEFSVNVRGIEIAQKPVPLVEPVPLDQFFRVQEMLALRRGKSTSTPIGEFLLNLVYAYHKRCKDVKVGPEKTRRVRIRGYIEGNNPNRRRYKHEPATPPCCLGGGYGSPAVGWERDELEGPILTELRRLASHPEILRELSDVVKHSNAARGTANSQLSAEEIEKLKREIEDLGNKRDAAVEAWVDSLPMGERPDIAAASRLMQTFDSRIAALEMRLQRDQDARHSAAGSGPGADASRRDERLEAFLEILTVETPDDLRHKALRGRLFERLVHAVEVDEDEDGNVVVTIEGFLVPPDTPYASRDLVDASADLLDSYLLEKEGKPVPQDPTLRRVGELRAEMETDLSVRTDKSVWDLYPDLLTLPGAEQIAALERRDYASERWRHAFRCKDRRGVPAWRFTLPAFTPSTERRLPELADGGLRGRRIRQAALWFLANRHLGESVHYRELVAMILDAGFVIPTKDPAASLFSSLIRSGVTDHPARGMFRVLPETDARLEKEIEECRTLTDRYQTELAALPEDAHRRAKPSQKRKDLQKVLQETRWREQRLQENLAELRMVSGIDLDELSRRVLQEPPP